MNRIVITTLVFGLQLFAQDGIKRPGQVTTTDRIAFAPGGTIRLTTKSSNLFVEAWDRPEVEITTIKSGKNAKCLDDVRVITDRRSDTELAISTPVKCGAKIEQHVNAPRDSHLVIQHGAGYLMVSRISGDIEATSRSGDIVLMLPDPGPYSIDAKSKFGSVTSDFAGTSHRKKLLGEQFASANSTPSRRIFLRIGFGGITIKEVPLTPAAPVPAGAQ